MDWHEITILTTTEASEAIGDMLIEIGAKGIAIEDPQDILNEINKSTSLDYADENFMNNLGTDVKIKVYFSENESKEELKHLLDEKLNHISKFLDIGKGEILFNKINQEDWASAWKKHFKPFKLAGNIVIKPTWESYDKLENEIIIEIDPGMAFGTGTHETTKLCSEFLVKYIKENDDIIDVGTGSGILSIVASKLGGKSITSIDIDKDAVKVAKENIELNKLSSKIEIYASELKEVKIVRQDIIVANIIADVIIDIVDDIKKRMKDNGIVICSGIILERENDVTNQYVNNGFKLIDKLILGEWVALVFKWQDSL